MLPVQESARRMIVFPIGTSGQRLVFSSAVVGHFRNHRQLRWWHREAGGQLFARFAMPDIVIEKATGPRRSDWRTRYSYRPNRRAEQREFRAHYARGLHFVGDWHTHPESIPRPSSRDQRSMQEMVTRSAHALNGFVLVIVGQEDLPGGVFVALVDHDRAIKLPLIQLPSKSSPDAKDEHGSRSVKYERRSSLQTCTQSLILNGPSD
jgi:integrative and conjugative element protein (TIGR02256 family)